jgi:hypothetical protein
MKTRIVTTLTLFLTMLFCASITYSAALPSNDSTSNASLIKAKALVMRLDIINATDQSIFTKTEKRILRKEVRFIKGNLKELRGGRYIPTMLIVMLVLIPVSVFQLTE